MLWRHSPPSPPPPTPRTGPYIWAIFCFYFRSRFSSTDRHHCLSGEATHTSHTYHADVSPGHQPEACRKGKYAGHGTMDQFPYSGLSAALHWAAHRPQMPNRHPSLQASRASPSPDPIAPFLPPPPPHCHLQAPAPWRRAGHQCWEGGWQTVHATASTRCAAASATTRSATAQPGLHAGVAGSTYLSATGVPDQRRLDTASLPGCQGVEPAVSHRPRGPPRRHQTPLACTGSRPGLQPALPPVAAPLSPGLPSFPCHHQSRDASAPRASAPNQPGAAQAAAGARRRASLSGRGRRDMSPAARRPLPGPP